MSSGKVIKEKSGIPSGLRNRIAAMQTVAVASEVVLETVQPELFTHGVSF